MKTTRLLISFMVFSLMLSACGTAELIPMPTTTAAPAPASTATPVVVSVPKTNPSGPISSTPDQSQNTSYPKAVLSAEKSLASDLSVDASSIKVVRYEDVQWPDGCLGIERPGIMCTAVIVPGYRVILEANGKQYEYRTNASGSTAVQYPGSKLSSGQPIGGTKSNAEGQVLVWHTEGGIAGLCQDMTIDPTGLVSTSSCAGGQSRLIGHGQLNADELAQLNQWLIQYKSFKLVISDPAVVDGMSTQLSFTGSGTVDASAANQQSILNFAKVVFNRISS